MRNCILLLLILILPFGVVPNTAHAADTSGERWRISKCFGATQVTEKVVLRDAIGHFDIALATDQLSTFERARNVQQSLLDFADVAYADGSGVGGLCARWISIPNWRKSA